MIEQALERLQVQRPQGLKGIMKRVCGSANRLVDALQCMRQRQRQRIALARLDSHLLDDIGVSADAARCEAAKPPWRE